MKIYIRNTIIVFLLGIGMLLLVLDKQIWGLRGFIVTSASMEPTITTGSFLINSYTHPTTLQKGDIITFIPPTKNREFVTHRLIKVAHGQNLSTFTTKGDHNKHEDTWILAGGAIIGKVTFIVPYLGYALSFMQSKLGIVFFILIPAVYIIVDEIYIIISTFKNHKKKNKTVKDEQLQQKKDSFHHTLQQPQNA